MAELWDESKTEAPTQHHREEAREQGQVARSADLASSLMLLAGLAALWLGGEALASGLLDNTRSELVLFGHCTDLNAEQVQSLLATVFTKGLELVSLLLAMGFLVGLAGGVLQVGFQVTPQVLAINWERLSPVQGWTRLFSLTSGMRALMAVLKAAVVIVVTYCVLRSRLPEIASFQQLTLAATVAHSWKLILHLALAVAGTLGVLGAADYLWQWWRLEQSLRMSKQELKEEHKTQEGDPQVKLRVRKLQRANAQKRMMQNVPKATVIVTNPTHLAIALQYDRATMKAPKVLAKGAGFVAARIVALARRHAVPVVERKPVAQALFKSVKVGQEIPGGLYHAVAEVLAYVFRLRAG